MDKIPSQRPLRLRSGGASDVSKVSQTRKIVIGLLGGVSLLVLVVCGYVLFTVHSLISHMGEKMDTGTAYMQSITEEDIPFWTETAQNHLGELEADARAGYGLVAGRPIPEDLEQLGITRVDIYQDEVIYVWLGGMDHNYLKVKRHGDGSFSLTANYNDKEPQVLLWPKEMDDRSRRRYDTMIASK